MKERPDDLLFPGVSPEEGIPTNSRGLTWPQNRKGRRKVRPRHIQDWNPSVETEEEAKGPCEGVQFPPQPPKHLLPSHASPPRLAKGAGGTGFTYHQWVSTQL